MGQRTQPLVPTSPLCQQPLPCRVCWLLLTPYFPSSHSSWVLPGRTSSHHQTPPPLFYFNDKTQGTCWKSSSRTRWHHNDSIHRHRRLGSAFPDNPAPGRGLVPLIKDAKSNAGAPAGVRIHSRNLASPPPTRALCSAAAFIFLSLA